VIGGGAGEERWDRDAELYCEPSTRPGAKLPHAWLVDRRGHRLSTLDLVGKGAFTLVTGLAGAVWQGAADACLDQLGVPVRVVRIGTEDARDAYGEWRRVSEPDEDACLLVRPDGYIAWRCVDAPAEASAARDRLISALSAVLQR